MKIKKYGVGLLFLAIFIASSACSKITQGLNPGSPIMVSKADLQEIADFVVQSKVVYTNSLDEIKSSSMIKTLGEEGPVQKVIHSSPEMNLIKKFYMGVRYFDRDGNLLDSTADVSK